jgi:DNA polymerase-3 subunit gamma/tau
MSYQVLARKWRPQRFQELVGQEHVQRALINALGDDRLHHAYLFTGTRGVGKTTIARIFSKALNCEQGISANPCGECATCREIAEGRYVDLIEVDAASRTGVDDTRELLENVQYAPTRGRYKVYLIDEVHMFSKSSFNALLKTLEEPPPHVKFLLATTDPQKLPVTILSRCLQFNLKRLPVSQIVEHLQHVLTEESIKYSITALQLLAEAADGSMRDALSLLDQAIAFGAGTIEEQEVRDMLGTVSRDKVIGLLDALLSRDAAAALQRVSDLAEFSPDYESVLAELLTLLHHMNLAKTVPEALDEFVSARERILSLSETVSAEDLQLFYQIALIGRRDLPLSPDARQGFEMVMLRMLAFRPAEQSGKPVPATAAAQPQASQPQAAAGQQYSGTASPPSAKRQQAMDSGHDNPPGRVAEPAPVMTAAAPAEPGTQASADWVQVAQSLALGGLVKQLALNCTLKQRTGNTIVLQIASGHANLINPKAKQRLQQALGEYYNTDAALEIEVVQQAMAESPAETQQREIRQRQKQAEQAIEEDSFTRSLKENFDAELVPGSVKPVT